MTLEERRLKQALHGARIALTAAERAVERGEWASLRAALQDVEEFLAHLRRSHWSTTEKGG
jgi:hypothetical protein